MTLGLELTVVPLDADGEVDVTGVPDRAGDAAEAEPVDERLLIATRSLAQPLLCGDVGTLLAPWIACPSSKYSGLYMLPFSGLSAATG